MRLVIKQLLRPFSLEPGFCCPIPRTTWEAQIYPTRAFLSDLSSARRAQIALPFGGEVNGFKVTLDLHKGQIEVGSKGKKPVYIAAGCHPAIEERAWVPSARRLWLGVHKKQDWDLMARRRDMAEVFPIWLKLADWIPEIALPQKKVGAMHLLNRESLSKLFLAGFEGLLCPRFANLRYWGLVDEEEGDFPDGCPIGLIHEGARLIASLFFRQQEDTLYLLPHLPPAFHAGRLIHLKTREGDRLDIEWSKKTLRKVILYPASRREVLLCLQSKLKRFRIRTDLRRPGRWIERGTFLPIQPGQVLYCDRFSHT